MIEASGESGLEMNHEARSPVTKEDQHLKDLLKRAETGDRSVLSELREALDNHPEIWQVYGDIATQAEGVLIQLAAGDNLLMAESLQRKLRELKHDLGGDSPSALESLLIARITATWLQSHYYDALITQNSNTSEARAKMLQRHQDGAHRRHLTALKTLATVRKLLTPPLSPFEIATRMDRTLSRSRREQIAGHVPVMN
jgi:hypothetical protein